MRKREELAWAAGFVDGEGCFYSASSKRYPRLSISQNDKEVLERFQESVGLGKIYGPYPPRPDFEYRLNGLEKVQAVIAMLWPWLSGKKKEQAKKILAAVI